MKDKLKKKSSSALKWSSLGEIVSKIITPITTVILARLLTPEIFGIVATVTMVISFADTLSDSGFQKYIIQNDFKNENEYNKSILVAFTSNLFFSIILWILIIIFSEKLATLTGNPGLGIIFVVSGFSLIITSFVSIYSAVLKRDFDFKNLFYSRISNSLVPLLITVPLAVFGFGYWSIIIGTIIGNIASALILKKISKIKLSLYFNFNYFKNMFSFSFWSLLESICTWLSLYIGTFIVGLYLNNYFLGIYKITMTTVNGIFAIISTPTASVLFSTLSRLQKNKEDYDKAYLDFINIVSIIIIPIGFGIYMYKDLVTYTLLGKQWLDAIPFVGIYGLMCCFTQVLGQYCSEYFRGIGKPKYNVLMCILHLIVLVPVLIYSSKKGFNSLIYWRSLIKIQQILVYWLIMSIICKFNVFKIISSSWKSIVSSIVMFLFTLLLKTFISNIIFDIISIIICIIIYFCVYIFILKGKNEVMEMIKMFTGKGGIE